MFGEKQIKGVSFLQVDSKKRVQLPEFTGAENNDELVLLPMFGELILMNKIDYLRLINSFLYQEKMSTKPEEKTKYRNMIRSISACSYDNIKCDKSRRIVLPIKLESDEIYCEGKCKHLVLKQIKKED